MLWDLISVLANPYRKAGRVIGLGPVRLQPTVVHFPRGIVLSSRKPPKIGRTGLYNSRGVGIDVRSAYRTDSVTRLRGGKKPAALDGGLRV